ncbi:xanthine dehydrogenase family protein molybdopterin-binding subunit [Marasmitruncus massiliensis]|uniref:xanthine dehydrogenase family protein molybdopterin-binding subunit n=1 Tax=Marasmitruncus massiliensis TaxID=1944642 RepID=UPI000C7AED06|nr:xanthine dehydrogenase family protein molybdopterin-binding subunit [Marasmitruncus massiliensis]
MKSAVGTSVERIEAWEKVTGKAKYTGDFYSPGTLHARLVTSSIAHGRILSIDFSKARKQTGVRAVLDGKSFPALFGTLLEDQPALAIDKVRYFGEPLAIIVAASEAEASLAAELVEVEYEPLPVINSAQESVQQGAPLIHEAMMSYKKGANDLLPQAGTNVAASFQIRKGNLSHGWAASEVVIEEHYSLPGSDHAAMEVRVAQAEIKPGGTVEIMASTQSPFAVKKQVSKLFNIPEGKVVVRVPFLGGGFGGKAAVYLEVLAYMASFAVGGSPVRLTITREQDMASCPARLGLEADIKLGAARDGTIVAAEMLFLLDTGAYCTSSPYMSKAIAADCTGPYNIENLWCDSLCVYTNHIPATSFRGFAHESYTFCIERALDALANRCGIDPLELRLKNAIQPGHFSPTQVRITSSNAGNTSACIQKLSSLINWEEGIRIELGDGKVRAKGMSCLWKTSTSPTDASAGAILTFNSDGSLNLNTGVVEMGSGGQTQLAQMLADRMKMDIGRVHVRLDVDTQLNPHYWKTVASMTTYMAGRAVIKAADDAIAQLKAIASVALRCPPEELELGHEYVYLRSDPQFGISFQKLVQGFKYPNGNAVGGQIIGRGSFIMGHLTPLSPETGKGKTGPDWTVGAQAVEVELDTTEFTYRIIKAATVMDVGKLINPRAAEGIICGGMSMGLSLASREYFPYNGRGVMQATSLRNYKLLHIGQEPDYLVGFVETPQEDSPYGARVFSEHGIIGIPAALANALSTASNSSLNRLPITPETIWKSYMGGKP